MASSQQINRDFGAWVKTKRAEKGLSQEGAAKMADVDRQTWFRIENGLQGTRRDTVLRIADALGANHEEALNKAGFGIPSGPPTKPQNAAEFAERLREMGFEIQTDFDFEKLGPDDLQEIVDRIEADLLIKVKRRKQAR